MALGALGQECQTRLDEGKRLDGILDDIIWSAKLWRTENEQMPEEDLHGVINQTVGAVDKKAGKQMIRLTREELDREEKRVDEEERKNERRRPGSPTCSTQTQ